MECGQHASRQAQHSQGRKCGTSCAPRFPLTVVYTHVLNPAEKRPRQRPSAEAIISRGCPRDMAAADSCRHTNRQINIPVATRQIEIFIIEKKSRVESAHFQEFVPCHKEHCPADPSSLWHFSTLVSPPPFPW